MKYSWKGHKDRNRHKNRIKRSEQARLVYVKDITATSTPRADEPVAEEMLDGQHQRVDIPAHARTAHKGLLQTDLKTGEDLC